MYDLLVQPSSTTNLRQRVLLKDVLKAGSKLGWLGRTTASDKSLHFQGADPLLDLPDSVVSLLGEAGVFRECATSFGGVSC